MADEDEAEEGAAFPKSIKACFMHFKDVRESSHLITKQRLDKFICCRKKWIKLDGEQADICNLSYGLFSDELGQEKVDSGNDFDLEWSYHKTCYKLLCEEEKIRRAEAKKRNTADNSKETAHDDGGAGSDVDLCLDTAPFRKLTRLEMKMRAMRPLIV